MTDTTSLLWDHFIPIVVETLGVLGQEAICFFKELGKGIWFLTFEPIKSGAYLIQQVAVALQHSNAASILGTLKMIQFISGPFYNFFKLKIIYWSINNYTDITYYI